MVIHHFGKARSVSRDVRRKNDLSKRYEASNLTTASRVVARQTEGKERQRDGGVQMVRCRDLRHTWSSWDPASASAPHYVLCGDDLQST